MGSRELLVGGVGSRIVTLPPPYSTPTVFQVADSYSTSHVSRQIVLIASSRHVPVPVLSRPRSKSSQIVMYPTHFSTSPTTLHSPLSHPQHTSHTSPHTPIYTSLHISPALPHPLPSLSPHPNTLFHTSPTPPLTLPHKYPLLPQTTTLLKNCLWLIVGCSYTYGCCVAVLNYRELRLLGAFSVNNSARTLNGITLPFAVAATDYTVTALSVNQPLVAAIKIKHVQLYSLLAIAI